MKESALMEMTIVVPTKNRPHYVKRLLQYYLDEDFIGKIIIIDSSDNKIANKIRKHIHDIGRVNFQYVYSSGLPTMVIKENLSYIKTKYVSFLGDDDYIIPKGARMSIDYLNRNPEIVACRGEGFTITDSSISSEYISSFTSFNRLEENSSDRILEHFANYSTPFFHVCRSEMFIAAYSNAPSMLEMNNGYDRLIGDELIVSGLMLTYGKFASIEGLHLVRTNNVERVESRDSWYYDLDNEGRDFAIKDFTKKIATSICEQDQISFLEAEKVALSVQNNPVFTTKYNSDLTIQIKGFIKPILQSLNLLEFCVKLKSNFFIIKTKLINHIFVSKNKRLGLKNILNPDNFYHNEFMPVYKSLTDYDSKK
jgi:glycosyltransferase domain-containing protein|tara:strand:+ start:1392 stop:2492 length:1101 start_codon:yes stop_codon:yes gene_type:complete